MTFGFGVDFLGLVTSPRGERGVKATSWTLRDQPTVRREKTVLFRKRRITPWKKTNMTMVKTNWLFEDVSPIEDRNFQLAILKFSGGVNNLTTGIVAGFLGERWADEHSAGWCHTTPLPSNVFKSQGWSKENFWQSNVFSPVSLQSTKRNPG